jgi:hypothetical protein
VSAYPPFDTCLVGRICNADPQANNVLGGKQSAQIRMAITATLGNSLMDRLYLRVKSECRAPTFGNREDNSVVEGVYAAWAGGSRISSVVMAIAAFRLRNTGHLSAKNAWTRLATCQSASGAFNLSRT